MSRARVGYDFTPMPRKWHPAWAGSTMAMRGLRASLFELNDGGPITVEGDWLTSLCKQMHVGGRERPNVRKLLLDLQARGVLGFDGQTVAICFRPDSQLHRLDSERLANVAELSAIGRGSDIPIESTPRNDTDHDRQTDKTDKKEETRETRAPERARDPQLQRPEDVGFRWVGSLLGRTVFDIAPIGSYPREYAWIGSRPAEERERIRAAVEVEEYFVQNPAWCDAKKLQGDWQKLLAGRPKPLARALVASQREQLEKARERLLDASKALRVIEDLPWFDKEKANYPDRLTRARDAVAQARSEVAKVERGGAQAVAS